MAEIELTETEAAFVRSHPVIKVANEMDWPPFDFTEFGQPEGFSIDYIRLLAQKAGLEIEFVNGYTWDELLEQFKNRSIDVMPAFYHNDKREAFTLFTAPYYEVKVGILTNDKQNDFKKISDLAGKRVGIQASDGLLPILKSTVPEITLVEHPNNETLINLLATRQLDAVIGNSLLLAYLAKRNDLVQLYLKTFAGLFSKELSKISLHMGVNKSYPLLHQIIVKAQGSVTPAEIAKIEQKWLLREKTFPVTTVKLTPEEKKFIQNHPAITLAGGLSFEPFIMYDDDGKVIGHDAEIANLITKRTGLKINFELGQWGEIQVRAQKRQLDGLITAIPTKKRNAYYTASKSYLYYTPLIIVKKGNPKGIYALHDLAGKRVGLQRGNAFEDILAREGNKTENIYFDTIHDLIKAVVSEKTDFTILDESAFYVARQLGLESMIQAPFSIGKGINLHFLLRKDWPELTTIVDKGLKAITRSEKDAIRNRWLGAQKINEDNGQAKIPLTPDENTYLNKKGSIKICIDPKWMPYEHISKKGIYEGMSADYLKLFSDQLGLSIELYPTKTWEETLDALKSHKCDVIPIAKASEKRKSYFNFTTPYLTTPYVIATKTDEFFIEDISHSLDKPFAVTRGYLIADELRQKYPGIQLVEVESNREGLQKVRSGEAYGYIGATATLAYALHRDNISDIKITGKLPWGFELGVASRKDEPLLNDLFQKAVDNLTQKEIKQIHDKWIAVNIYKIVDYTLLWWVLGIITVILVILVESYRRISQANRKLTLLNSELVATLEENKTLKGIIPICSYCKKIRDDEGFWDQVECYVGHRTEAEFSHSLCPDCEERAYKDAGLEPPKD